MKKLRIVLVLFALVLLANLFAPAAMAHPLGNFTINHYAGLHITPEAVSIDYVLDMAEIPAFQAIVAFDANGNGLPDPSEAAAYHPVQCDMVRAGLAVAVNGRPATLTVAASNVAFPPGAGDLPTLRLTCTLQAAIDGLGQNAQVSFENNVYPERLGWREIVVSSEDVNLGGDLAAMQHSLTARLTDYPDDLLASPLDQRSVTFSLNDRRPSTIDQGIDQNAAVSGQPSAVSQAGARDDAFTELISLQRLTPLTILLALGVAFVWGAAHALTPGHGKTIVAAYLVGSRGTVKHAAFLGLATTITHTAGVFVLGFLTLFASRFILPEQLYPWLGVASGALVVWIGFSLFRGRLPGLMQNSQHHHDHHHHHDHTRAHDHHHHHGRGHTRGHLPPDVGDGQITWRSLLALGVSGGLIPCPSALVVMLSAIALGRIGFGLVLIVAFSLGLAGVLTVIGIVWVQARRLVERTPERALFLNRIPGRAFALRALPAASALIITVIGLGITYQALLQTGLLA